MIDTDLIGGLFFFGIVMWLGAKFMYRLITRFYDSETNGGR